MERLNLTINELKPFVLEAFKRSPETQYLGVCSMVSSILVEKGLINTPDYSFGGSLTLSAWDQDRVREIIWDLVIERVVTIGMNSSNPGWPFLSLTEYGLKVVNSPEPIPHDPSGYIKKIKEEIPTIDPVIIIYLEESLNAYNVNALLSSTITLGCASEKALLLIVDAYKNAIADSKKKDEFMKDTNGKFIKRQFDELKKRLPYLIQNAPSEISDGLDTVLLGIFEMIRNNRNDAGHPTGKSIPKEYVFASLQVFIPYCKKVYQLIDYLDHNSI